MQLIFYDVYYISSSGPEHLFLSCLWPESFFSVLSILDQNSLQLNIFQNILLKRVFWPPQPAAASVFEKREFVFLLKKKRRTSMTTVTVTGIFLVQIT